MGKPKISVIGITARYGGIDINWISLRRQQFTDFEWILVDTLYEERQEAVQSYTGNDKRVIHVGQGKKDPLAKTWLNHAENEGIRRAKAELIVLLQDYIHIEPDALEKFWIQYQTNPKIMVTGVGHQYGKPGKEDIVDPKGLITLFSKPFEGVPEQIVWTDPRIRQDMGSFYLCYPNDIEANFCAIPKKMLYEIGGMDETMDFYGHAWDNVSMAQRGYMLGYQPYIDQTNISKSVRHDDFFETNIKDNDWQIIANYCNQRLEDIRNGKLDINLGFL